MKRQKILEVKERHVHESPDGDIYLDGPSHMTLQ